MCATFPLRDGYFPPLQYSQDDLSHWKALEPELASTYDRVDAQLWKQIQTKDQLRVHQPRSCSAPCVLAVGTIEGTLEDVIYGIHNTTTRDIRVTRAFLSASSLDSAMLHVHAPKWRVVETPAGSLVKNRDDCVLEYMGISRDRNGRRYAFQVSETVDHPICPPFTQQGVVGANVHIRAIYRELDAGRVRVCFHAAYDMTRQIPKLPASWTAVSGAFAVGKSVECAQRRSSRHLHCLRTTWCGGGSTEPRGDGSPWS